MIRGKKGEVTEGRSSPSNNNSMIFRSSFCCWCWLLLFPKTRQTDVVVRLIFVCFFFLDTG